MQIPMCITHTKLNIQYSFYIYDSMHIHHYSLFLYIYTYAITSVYQSHSTQHAMLFLYVCSSIHIHHYSIRIYMKVIMCITHTKLNIQYSLYMYVIRYIFNTLQYSFYVYIHGSTYVYHSLKTQCSILCLHICSPIYSLLHLECHFLNL